MWDYNYPEFLKRLRRHEADVFNALFWDKEHLSDEYANEVIENVAAFFGIPTPRIHSHSESLAKVMTSHDAEKCEFYYNLWNLGEGGINNKDAITLCVVHEISHLALKDTRFFIFSNELWIQELACDINVGAYAKYFDLATGKYKWVVKTQKTSPTHPPGFLREKAVEYGMENGFSEDERKNVPFLDRVLLLLPSFVLLEHMTELTQEWEKVKALDWDKTYINPPEPEPRRIEDMADTNLIKQAVLKHRREQQQKETQQ